MHAKLLAVSSLCVAASVLQATEARGASAEIFSRRQLGDYKDHGHHHSHKHDHHKKHVHDDDKGHSHYRRRLEDAKTTESSHDYSYGHDGYGHDDYGHDHDHYKHKDYDHGKHDYKDYGIGYGYGCDKHDHKGYGYDKHDHKGYGYDDGYYGYGKAYGND